MGSSLSPRQQPCPHCLRSGRRLSGRLCPELVRPYQYENGADERNIIAIHTASISSHVGQQLFHASPKALGFCRASLLPGGLRASSRQLLPTAGTVRVPVHFAAPRRSSCLPAPLRAFFQDDYRIGFHYSAYPLYHDRTGDPEVSFLRASLGHGRSYNPGRRRNRRDIELRPPAYGPCDGRGAASILPKDSCRLDTAPAYPPPFSPRNRCPVRWPRLSSRRSSLSLVSP